MSHLAYLASFAVQDSRFDPSSFPVFMCYCCTARKIVFHTGARPILNHGRYPYGKKQLSCQRHKKEYRWCNSREISSPAYGRNCFLYSAILAWLKHPPRCGVIVFFVPCFSTGPHALRFRRTWYPCCTVISCQAETEAVVRYACFLLFEKIDSVFTACVPAQRAI